MKRVYANWRITEKPMDDDWCVVHEEYTCPYCGAFISKDVMHGDGIDGGVWSEDYCPTCYKEFEVEIS